ncbi:MAG: threonylcarbamoyladenosine tRNA methylthiotransferase MtaB [Candidatus Kentron sp. G]|nr:MAG: threonylcarbamoyladenosine tRNA methylthiotransferase MtaB [Candidatus Kentron sp. G]VFM97922.1 MAG: threonylcarbamoyladenosine tRNA methylthiotransferase MtaB [Candidatus Kentron sp. G]VFM98189.1 MAG: threonylcarbamoyladenosine tRNA methylthiotransferase MtaB [Candidatus Kentron sp. G]
MNRAAFCTFGCRINQYDTETIRTLLEETGRFHTVSPREAADVYVVNTCSVTAQADATARKAIRRIHSEHPEAKIVVTGCYAQRVPARIAELPGVVLILGMPDRAHIASEIQQVLEGPNTGAGAFAFPVPEQQANARKNIPRITVSPTATARTFPEIPITRMMNRSRAVVKIQDGCNGACSFCIIPQTRGHSRSRQPERVIEQITRLVDNGYREIVLAGVHLGDYGLDIGSGQPMLSLLIGRILAIPDLMRLRLSSIGPNAVTDEIIRLMATQDRFARHLHIPLQSGSDEILTRMNRNYSVAQFEKLLRAITDTIPDCGIGTDIICGFPGESDALFHESAARITDLPFSYLHPFPYSARPASPAESFGDQVPNEEKKSRTRILKGLSREKNRAFQRRHLGKRVKVLLENLEKNSDQGSRPDSRKKGNPAHVGWTDNYLRVAVRGGAGQDSNSGLQTVRITGLGEQGLMGVVEPG